MNKNLELISLDDDELLGVVGGCHHPCSPCPPPQCSPCPPPPPCWSPCGPTLDVGINVGVHL